MQLKSKWKLNPWLQSWGSIVYMQMVIQGRLPKVSTGRLDQFIGHLEGRLFSRVFAKSPKVVVNSGRPDLSNGKRAKSKVSSYIYITTS